VADRAEWKRRIEVRDSKDKLKASLHFQDSLPFFGYDRRKWLFSRWEQFDADVARQIQLSDGKCVELLTIREDSQKPLCLVNVHTQASLSQACASIAAFLSPKDKWNIY
jgi:hypothetical protein